MLKRQKVILDVLREAGQPLSPIHFVKVLFLLRNEPSFCDDRTFYEFVPYRDGPFSFALYRELNALRRDGYVSDSSDKISLAGRMRTIAIQETNGLSRFERQAIARVVATNVGLPQRDLLRSVYGRFPWYAWMTEFPELVPADAPQRPVATVAVYTVGYEGKSVDGFFNHLLASGISAIIDVRANPISRKYGFAKKSISEIARKLGLTYHHIPELGIQGSQRASLTDYRSYQRLLDRYETEMLPGCRPAVERAVDLLRQQPSAFLCMEKDVSCCHRGRLAKLAAGISNLPIIHL